MLISRFSGTLAPCSDEFVLVMVDQFTKSVECIPLSSQTAEVTAKAAVNDFSFRVPLPDFHGPREEFQEQAFSCCLQAAPGSQGSQHRPMARWSGITVPSWTQCSVMSTRHRTARALRSAMNRNSSFTSNKLMLGREVNTPILRSIYTCKIMY